MNLKNAATHAVASDEVIDEIIKKQLIMNPIGPLCSPSPHIGLYLDVVVIEWGGDGVTGRMTQKTVQSNYYALNYCTLVWVTTHLRHK